MRMYIKRYNMVVHQKEHTPHTRNVANFQLNVILYLKQHVGRGRAFSNKV